MQKIKNSASGTEPTGDFRSASGTIRFTFTNDFMFKFIFQNTKILSGFLCALLRLSPEEIKSIKVNNPIILGQHVSDKTFILDINITLNDDTLINIEMQIANLRNWTDRSLSYLCRTFDHLYQGEDYGKTKYVLHISILDFTLFPECPEFYATYKLLNTKNYEIYSDKLRLHVLELNQIPLATAEDKAYGLDHWAALFKSKTWEEIKMLAASNPVFGTAADELYKANEDERIRLECQARQDYYLETRRRQSWLEEAEAKLSELNAVIAEKNAIIAEKNATLAEKDASLAEKDAANRSLLVENASLRAQLAEAKKSSDDEG